MNKVVRFPTRTAKQRFRAELETAISILHRQANGEIIEDLVQAVQDLAKDLVTAVECFRNDGQL
jgi:hypothetical protein